jgi:hypothetical protein
MLNYTLFIPAALLLAVLAVLLTRAHSATSLTRAGILTFVLWFASWLTVVSFLYARPSSTLLSSFSLQRDLGYLAGSAALMSIPFLAVLACGSLLSSTQTTQLAKRVVALLVAGILCLSLPWFFFAGWVFGCAMLGGSSCL